MKIVLLGYMGSGKSTVGQELAKALKLPFKDLDQEIETQIGVSVSEIFDQKGELFFRKKETAVLEQLLTSSAGFVLALGGGTPCYGNNMGLIEAENTATSFYLKAKVVELTLRLKNGQEQRPLLAGRSEADLMEFIGKHLFERMPFYERADHVVDIASKSVDQLVEELKSLLQVG
jgi:shikimate kinase